MISTLDVLSDLYTIKFFALFRSAVASSYAISAISLKHAIFTFKYGVPVSAVFCRHHQSPYIAEDITVVQCCFIYAAFLQGKLFASYLKRLLLLPGIF